MKSINVAFSQLIIQNLVRRHSKLVSLLLFIMINFYGTGFNSTLRRYLKDFKAELKVPYKTFSESGSRGCKSNGTEVKADVFPLMLGRIFVISAVIL